MLETQIEKGWISVDDALPPCIRGTAYHQKISELVLAKSEKVLEGKKPYQYPFVAHLHKEYDVKYRSYAHAQERGGDFYTWLNPYAHARLQHITHWRYIC
jgi:hypothetical protein